MAAAAPEPITAAVDAWAEARLAALCQEAEEVAARYYARAALERRRRPRSQWGKLGVRVRLQRTPRAAPGAFTIEWFMLRWTNQGGGRPFTRYIRRGAGERYPHSALAAAAEPWELAIADALEERFAEIRRLARNVSRVRMTVRQHAKLERAIAERRPAAGEALW